MIAAADVLAWLGTASTPATAESMQGVVDAVIANIARTHTAPIPAVPPVAGYDADWDLAHVMQSARWWKRKASPEGVIASDEFGVIRVTRLDADIVVLLEPFLQFNFA